MNHEKTYKQALRANDAVYFENQMKEFKRRCATYREELIQWKKEYSDVEKKLLLRSKEEEKFFEQIQELQIKLNNVVQDFYLEKTKIQNKLSSLLNFRFTIEEVTTFLEMQTE